DCIVEPHSYNPADSSTSEDGYDHFFATFQDGSDADGRVYRDIFEIAGLRRDEVTIGVAAEPFLSHAHHPAEGVCGLAFEQISFLDKPGFFFELMESDEVERSLFALALSRYGPSELTLGGANPELFYDVSLVPVVAESGFWEIEGALLGRENVRLSFRF
ncbi:hypothetical protein OC861_006755, partial [Tilletia horrida]